MAQMVGYFENNVVFTEGPFVVVYAGGYRIEVEQKGHHCPVLPVGAIYTIKERLGMRGKTPHEALAVKVCDQLNEMVKKGEIVLDGPTWVPVGTIGERVVIKNPNVAVALTDERVRRGELHFVAPDMGAHENNAVARFRLWNTGGAGSLIGVNEYLVLQKKVENDWLDAGAYQYWLEWLPMEALLIYPNGALFVSPTDDEVIKWSINKFEAIRMMRTRTGCGLLEAKTALENAS